MAFPLLIPAAAAGVAYVKGRWFSDDDENESPNYAFEVAKIGLMGVGAYAVFRIAKKQLKEVTK